MKHGWIICMLFLVLAVTAFLLSSCTQSQPAQTPETTATTTTTTATTTADPTEPPHTPDHLTFTGKVLEVNDGMALMDCYDKTKFDTVWVNYSNTPSVTPQVGEQYVVAYEDFMMPSLPPRIFAVEMTLLYSEPLTE